MCNDLCKKSCFHHISLQNHVLLSPQNMRKGNTSSQWTGRDGDEGAGVFSCQNKIRGMSQGRKQLSADWIPDARCRVARGGFGVLPLSRRSCRWDGCSLWPKRPQPGPEHPAWPWVHKGGLRPARQHLWRWSISISPQVTASAPLPPRAVFGVNPAQTMVYLGRLPQTHNCPS